MTPQFERTDGRKHGSGSAHSSRDRRWLTGTRALQVALPLGGIGAGCVCLNGFGGLQDFSIRHKPSLTAAQRKLAEAIEAEYRSTGVNPPFVPEIEKKHGAGAKDVLALLVDEGKLVRVTSDLVFHTDALDQAENALRAYLKERGQMTVAEFRDVVNSSRKYVVPLLEYFDAKKVTERHGDLRRLAGQIRD